MQIKNSAMIYNRLLICIILILASISSVCQGRVKLPNDYKWKNIYAIQVDDSAVFEVKKRGKLKKGDITEIRIIRMVPFQDLEKLPDSKGLDEIIKEKNCQELTEYFKTNNMPLTFIDSGPLDLTPKNSKRFIRLTKGYMLIARTTSDNTVIVIKPIK
jgi:hypothetical protein